MLKIRLIALASLLIAICIGAITLSIPMAVVAQDQDVGTPPVPLTPGEPFKLQTGDIVPTLPFTDSSCYTPFPLIVGDRILIEPGVNIRSEPNGSSAIVWNTSYNQYDANGERLVLQDQILMEAFITGGPVCSFGYNWWQIDFPAGKDGWVSEGRPTDKGGYLIQVPGINFSEDCSSPFPLQTGDTAVLTQNVRVREEPNTSARVVTVVPLGTELQLLEGPKCDVRTGMSWFRIQVTVVNFPYEGWIAQGQGGAYWLIPTDLPSEEAGTLCGRPLTFAVGDIGYVNTLDERPRNLRDAPGLDSNVTYVLVDGVPFKILGGPTCVNNINWWQIHVLSSNPAPVDGWIAEGSQGVGYWLSKSEKAIVPPATESAPGQSALFPEAGTWTFSVAQTFTSTCLQTGSQTLLTSDVYGPDFLNFDTELTVTGPKSFIFGDIPMNLVGANFYYGETLSTDGTSGITAYPSSSTLMQGELIYITSDCTSRLGYTATKK